MIKILIGLLVLSIMVFIHELGHFLIARLCGVAVETFSIGWGPVIFRKKIKGTEYRISLIPIGGYCGMRGEKAFVKALEENLPKIPKEEGGLYSASPFKRILIAFAGPFSNYISAVVCFAIISAMGSIYYTYSNTVAPIHCYDANVATSAKEADLQVGDRIIEIDGKKVDNFREIMLEVMTSPDKNLMFKIERGGKVIEKQIKPKLNPKTGSGLIGIYPFVKLQIENVSSTGATQGLKKGDIIRTINGKNVNNTIELQNELDAIYESQVEKTILGIDRDGNMFEKEIYIIRLEHGGIDLGLSFQNQKIIVKGTGFFASIVSGFVKTHETILLTFKSFALLFKGIDLKQAVSGPLRITHMIGDVAQEGFKSSMAEGWASLLSFIAIISISLFIMNLLPIPVLDGGLILLSFIEAVMRHEISPKITYRVQFIGFAFIAVIFVFAIVTDVLFLIG
ncbi:MAG: RIP metalloprotease RseP [Treponema sp.]